MYFRYFVIIIIPWKRQGLSSNNIQEYFVLILVEIGPVVLEKKTKMLKVFENDGKF